MLKLKDEAYGKENSIKSPTPKGKALRIWPLQERFELHASFTTLCRHNKEFTLVPVVLTQLLRGRQRESNEPCVTVQQQTGDSGALKTNVSLIISLYGPSSFLVCFLFLKKELSSVVQIVLFE